MNKHAKKFLREKLADLAHKQWSGWMKWMFKQGYYKPLNLDGSVQMCWIMPNALVNRWERQMKTDYADLPENEKDSDREEADRMIIVFEQPLICNIPNIGDARCQREHGHNGQHEGWSYREQKYIEWDTPSDDEFFDT